MMFQIVSLFTFVLVQFLALVALTVAQLFGISIVITFLCLMPLEVFLLTALVAFLAIPFIHLVTTNVVIIIIIIPAITTVVMPAVIITLRDHNGITGLIQSAARSYESIQITRAAFVSPAYRQLSLLASGWNYVSRHRHAESVDPAMQRSYSHPRQNYRKV